MNVIRELKKLGVGKVIASPLMKDYTTYKVGGMALALVIPYDCSSLITLLKYLRMKNITYKILGNGSNVIFNDSNYNGIIIKLSEFNNLKIINNKIIVGAGYMLNKLAIRLSRLGFTGIEFAAGIPGTVGGSIYMNAGAYKSDMGYIVRSIKVLTPDYEIKTLTNQDLNFHYRSSYLQYHKDYICIEATIHLVKGNQKEIMELINERKARRVETQPLEYPSAGSVFRNPKDNYAGKLIEDSGCKGKRIGDAQVSLKHANFIVNLGSARGEDVKALIEEVRDTVKEKYNIELKIEQEFVE